MKCSLCNGVLFRGVVWKNELVHKQCFQIARLEERVATLENAVLRK